MLLPTRSLAGKPVSGLGSTLACRRILVWFPLLRSLNEVLVTRPAAEQVRVKSNSHKQREPYGLSTDNALTRSETREHARVTLWQVFHYRPNVGLVSRIHKPHDEKGVAL